MSFADLEARTNSAVMQRLSNARAQIVGGAEIPVIFDRAHVETFGGSISGTAPIAAALTADVSTVIPRSSELTISGTTYSVLDKHPDGTGMTTLVLQEAG